MGITTVSPPAGSSHERPSYLELVAQAYYTCMTDAGLPMTIRPDYQGKPTIVDFVLTGSYAWRDPYGGGGSGIMPGDEGNPALTTAINDLMDFTSTRVGLIIGGEDRTSDYAACLKKTSYSEQATVDPVLTTPNPEWLARMEQSTRRWAACAEDHGWPQVRLQRTFSPPYTTYTAAIVPYTITPDQVRQLLDPCPVFDPVMDEMVRGVPYWQADTALPDGWLPDPVVDFGPVGLEAAYAPGWMPADQQDMITTANRELTPVLWEAQQAYQNQTGVIMD